MEEKVRKACMLINKANNNQCIVIVHAEGLLYLEESSAQTTDHVHALQLLCSCSSLPPDVTLLADVTISAS